MVAKEEIIVCFLWLPPMRGVVFVTGSMSPTIVPKSTIANSKLTPGGEVNISYFQICNAGNSLSLQFDCFNALCFVFIKLANFLSGLLRRELLLQHGCRKIPTAKWFPATGKPLLGWIWRQFMKTSPLCR